MTRVPLICLPYAGGGSRAYTGWAEHLPSWVDVVTYDLPGRGLRFAEELIDDLTEVLDDLRVRVGAAASGSYAIFGHSLGALLGYELALELTRAGRPPAAFFPSGAMGAHLPSVHRAHELDDDALRRHVVALGGTPPEVTDDDQMMELLTPVLRADFALAENYRPRTGQRLPCPVVAFAGEDDAEAPPVGVDAWSDYAPVDGMTAGYRRHTLPGDHFFLDSARPELLDRLAGELRDVTGTEPPPDRAPTAATATARGLSAP